MRGAKNLINLNEKLTCIFKELFIRVNRKDGKRYVTIVWINNTNTYLMIIVYTSIQLIEIYHINLIIL